VSLSVTGNLAVNGNITTNAGDVLFKASGNIVQAVSTSMATSGGDVTYWSNSAGNGGYVQLGAGVSVTSGGGDIVLGGGSTSPLTGYATGTSDNTFTIGLWMDSVTLNSGGGFLSLRGKSSNASAATANYAVYIKNSTLNAGTGKVYVEGVGLGAGAANVQAITIEASTSITSANTASDAIRLVGNAGSANAATSLAINIGGSTLAATGTGGGIILEATGGVGTTYDHAIDLNSTSLLSASGAVLVLANNAALSGSNNAYLNFGGDNTFGFKVGSSVASSSANITLRTDGLTVGGSNYFNSSGAVTIESVNSSFASAQTLSSGLVFGNTLSGLTVGKTTNTANITAPVSLSIAGSLAIYGGQVDVQQGLTAAGAITLKATSADVLLSGAVTNNASAATTLTVEAARHIRLGANASITASNAAMSTQLWADTDTSGDGIVYMESSGITTAGGALTFGKAGQVANLGGQSVMVGGEVFFEHRRYAWIF